MKDHQEEEEEEEEEEEVAGFMMHPKKGVSVKKEEKISVCPRSTRRTRSSGRHHNADHQQNAMRLSPQGGDRGPSREQPEPLKQAGAPGNEGVAPRSTRRVRTRSSGRHYNADHEQNAASLSPQGGDKGSSREQPEPLKKASAPGDEGVAPLTQFSILDYVRKRKMEDPFAFSIKLAEPQEKHKLYDCPLNKRKKRRKVEVPCRIARELPNQPPPIQAMLGTVNADNSDRKENKQDEVNDSRKGKCKGEDGKSARASARSSLWDQLCVLEIEKLGIHSQIISLMIKEVELVKRKLDLQMQLNNTD